MKSNLEGQHYSFDQILGICRDLDEPVELSVSRIRTHAMNTCLVKEVTGQIKSGPMRYLVPASDV